jgi:hypothetical protein
LLILIIVGLIGGVGYYVYKVNKEEVNVSDSTIQPKNTKDEVITQKHADWQVYKDTKNGFSLEYPKDWKFIQAGTKAGGGEFPSAEFIPASEFPSGDNSKALFINNIDRTDLALEQYVGKYAPKFDGGEGGSKLVSDAYSTINNYDAYTKIGQIYGGNNYYVYVTSNGVVVEFLYLDNDASLLNTYKKIIESIQFNN